MPEMPQMQALAERVGTAVVGREIQAVDVLGFSALKTVDPPPESLVGHTVTAVGRRGKYLVFEVDDDRVLVHLSQAGRLDLEGSAKTTKPRGAVLRVRFDDGSALLVREHGRERKASWWVLGPGDEGPLAGLGPEVASEEFADLLLHGDDRRRIHTILRDQRTVTGVGRGYSVDALWRARLSPYATLVSLGDDERERLLEAVRGVLDDGLELERRRTGGLSAPKLGEHFEIHRHWGEPCPRCEDTLRRVSYESYEITYCPTCQTDGRVLADRRMSRLVK